MARGSAARSAGTARSARARDQARGRNRSVIGISFFARAVAPILRRLAPAWLVARPPELGAISRRRQVGVVMDGMAAVIALLGPTNTGKTYHAVERLLAHRTGMIGFPLRLLARENYDRLVAQVGAGSVALVTGEERIVPPSPRYFVCTVEAMPLDRRVECLAVDEVQLAADRERGHVFTDRLLHARGTEETMFLGASTIAPLLRPLVPEAGFIRRERLSTLSYAGHKK